ARSVDAVVFTYDVYSFLPDREERVQVLAGMRAWLRPGGTVFLSARTVQSAWARSILTAQRVRWGTSFGASHTRWIASDGSLRRSFVQVFSGSRLRGEIESAGMRAGDLAGGHVVLEAAR